ncbi:MAG: hypothetical protein ACK56I_22780, partial [bacterium]
AVGNIEPGTLVAFCEDFMRSTKTESSPIYIAELRLVQAQTAGESELQDWSPLGAPYSDQEPHCTATDFQREDVIAAHHGLGLRNHFFQAESRKLTGDLVHCLALEIRKVTTDIRPEDSGELSVVAAD